MSRLVRIVMLVLFLSAGAGAGQVDVFFVGGQSNAKPLFRDSVQAALAASQQFPDMRVVWMQHPGTPIGSWYDGTPQAYYREDLYNPSGATGALQAVCGGIVASGNTYRIRGFFWFQGESDSHNQAEVDAYSGKLSGLLGQLATDLNHGEPVPFALARIAYNPDNPLIQTNPVIRAAYEAMNTLQQEMADLSPVGSCADTWGYPRVDHVHLTDSALTSFGTALVAAFLAPRVYWTGAGPDDDWTTTTNWSPSKLILPGDAVWLGGTDGRPDAGTVNNRVASNLTAGVLRYYPSGDQWHNTRIEPGATLTLDSSDGIRTFGAGNSVFGVTTSRVTIAGGGALNIVPAGGGNILFGAAQDRAHLNAGVVDMGELGTLIANLGTGGVFRLGDAADAVDGGVAAWTVTLASNTTLTAGSVDVGASTLHSGTQSLLLGAGSQVLNVASIDVGCVGGRSSGTVGFRTGDGSVTIRSATDPVDGRATLGVANVTSGTGAPVSGSFEVAGHNADVRLESLTIGCRNPVAAGSEGGTTGTVSFDSGRLDVSTVRLGLRNNVTNANSIAATLHLGGGTVTLGSILVMGQNDNSGAGTGAALASVNITGGTVYLGDILNMAANDSFNGAVTATLNCTGGSITMSGSIARCPLAGDHAVAVLNLGGATLDMGGFDVGGADRAALDGFTFSGGTLRNVGTVYGPMTLGGAGLREFCQESGTGTVTGALGGGAAGLIKTGGGTLSLGAATTYQGATLVSQGTLLAGSLSGTGAVAVLAGAVFGGNGVIAGGIVSDGTIHPRLDGIGTITCVGDYVMTSNAVLAIELGGNAVNDLLDAGGTATLAGTLEVTLAGGYAPRLDDRFTMVRAGTACTGTFSTVQLPAMGGGHPWGWALQYSNATVSLCVTGAPDPMLVTPDGYEFGITERGTSAAGYFMVTNTTGTAFDGTSAIASGFPVFVVSNGATFHLEPGASTNVWISFSPQTLGAVSGTVVFACDAGVAVTNQLRGVGGVTTTVFHVTSGGDDAGDGSAAFPFATLEQARDTARYSLRGNRPVEIWLHGGDYVRTNSFELTEADSNCVYRAMPGEVPRFIGGARLDPAWFTPVTSNSPVWSRLDATARGNVVECDLGAHGITDYGILRNRGYSGTAIAPMELFVAGRPQTLGRWPNDGAWDTIATAVSSTVFTYGSTRPSRWTQAEEVWFHGFFKYYWADFTRAATSINTSTKRVTLASAPGGYGILAGQPYFAFNLLEEIDTPGEYYIKRDTGKLYFWPPAGYTNSEITVSMLESNMIHVAGSHDLAIEGVDMSSVRGSLVRIDSGTNIVFRQCRLSGPGSNGADINGRSNGLVRCEIADCGSAGVNLGGGDRHTLERADNYVRNCVIHDFQRLTFTYVPAAYATGVGQTVSHCEIYGSKHCAVLFSGNEHSFDYNNIHAVCRWTGDAGAIYCGRDWGLRGNKIRYNFIHDVNTGFTAASLVSFGIYLDDCASGVSVFGNVLYRVDDNPLFNGGGRDNLWENNVVARCGSFHYSDVRGTAYITNAVGSSWNLLEKIQAYDYQNPPWSVAYPALAAIPNNYSLLGPYKYPGGTVFSRNVSWLNTVEYDLKGNPTAYYAQMTGNLTGQDPLFVNESLLNLALKTNSPALQIAGFVPIPFGEIGPEGLVWDAAPGEDGVQDGDGAWRSGYSNWWDGASCGWNNFSPTRAVFGSTAGVSTNTVTLADDITTTGLTFSNRFYRIDPDAGNLNSLTLTGPAEIRTLANGMIAATLAGTNGLLKSGAGTLTLAGANTFAGGVTMGDGTVHLTGGDNRLSPSGTLTFAAAGILSIEGAQTLAKVTLVNSVTGTISGSGGTLTLGANAFGINTSGSAHLNLSALGHFVYDNTNLMFNAGGNTAASATTTLTLSPSSTITAASVHIGSDGGLGTARTVTLNLGSNTAVNADALYIGCYNQDGNLRYGGATATPVLTLRGATSGRVADMRVGRNSAGVNNSIGTVDLVSNVTGGGTLDALIDSLTVGVNDRGMFGGASMGVIGSFLMGGGTLDATTLTLGRITAGSTESVASTVVGTFTTGAGNSLVKVGALYLGDTQVNASNFTVTATFNLNSGATLRAQTLDVGPGSGTGGVWNRRFNWNDGTVSTFDAGTDLTVGSGITFTLAATGTHVFDMSGGRSGSVAAVLAGAGGTLVKRAAGALTLTGVNTYTGGTTVEVGTLTIGAGGKLGNGNYSGPLSVSAGAVLNYASTAVQTFSGVLSGTGTFTIRSGTFTLNNATLSGGGPVTVESGATLAGSGTIAGHTAVADGGALVTGGTAAVGRLMVGSLALPAGYTNVIDIASRGVSNDVLTVTGTLSVSGGCIAVNLLDLPPTNGVYRVLNYGTLEGGFVPVVLGNTGRKTMTLDTATPGVVNLVVDGASPELVWYPPEASEHRWDDGGTISWTNLESGVACDFMTGDAVLFDDRGVTSGNGVVNIPASLRPSSVRVGSGGSYRFTGPGGISGTPEFFIKEGSGVLTMAVSNDFTTTVAVSGGVFRAESGAAFGAGSVVVAAGASLELTNGVGVARPLTLAGAGVGGAGALRNVAGSNTWSGAITLAGSARINSAGGTLALNAATLTTGGFGLTLGGAGDGSLSSVIGGTGPLTKDGAGSFRLIAANTFTGGTTIDEGTLVVGNGATAGFLSGTITVNGAGTLAFDRTGGPTFSNTLTGAGHLENRNTQIYYSGNMTGFTGVFTALPGSRLDFIGTSSGSTGAVFVLNGAVPISATGLTVRMGELSGATGFITAGGGVTGGTLIVGELNTDSTFGGTLAGNTGRLFTKAGTGALTITGSIIDPVGITVSGGRLIIDGKKTGTGVVTVSSGGTLGGTGTVAGVMTVSGGGALSPGDPAVNGGVGTLTTSNVVTLASNSTFAVQVGGPGVCDRLVSVGNVTNLNATLSVSIVPGGIAARTKYTVMTAPKIVGTFRGLPAGRGVETGGWRFLVDYPGGTNVVLEAWPTGMLLMVQ